MNTDIIDQTALELVHFTVDPASESDMLDARPGAVAAIRAQCPGLIDARLFRGEEAGEWIDVWFWESLDAATSASEAAMGIPEAAAFFACIASPPTMIHGTLAGADVIERS